jgi:hypothetical protein
MSASVIGRVLGLALAMAVVLSFGVASVESAIPSNGTYYACLTKRTGTVKVINYPKKRCAKGHKLIKWSVKGPVGPQGPQGVQRPQGAQGPKGDQGPAGPADWNAIPNISAGFADGVDNDGVTAVKVKTVVSPTPITIYPGGFAFAYADCPAGFLAVGGGYMVVDGYVDVFVFKSAAGDADTWQVRAWKPDTSPGSVTIRAQVHCLRAEPAGLVIAAKNSHYGPKKAHVRAPDK